MKAHYKTKNGRITFEVEGELIKDIFEKIAQLQDIFESEQECGLCGSDSTRLVARENDGHKYHELRCLDCGGQFSFGQLRNGGDLFPRRKDKDGNWLPDHGWSKYDAKAKAPTPPAPQQQTLRTRTGKVTFSTRIMA